MSPGGLLVSASQDTTLRVWDTLRGECVGVLEGHGGGVNAVCALGGGRIASASSDRSVRLWDVDLDGEGGGRVVGVLEGHLDDVLCVCAPLAVVGWGEGKGKGRGKGGVVHSCHWVASGSADTTLLLWPLGAAAATGEVERRGARCSEVTPLVLRGHSGWVRGVCSLLGGVRLASASDDGTVRVWDAVLGSALAVLAGHSPHMVPGGASSGHSLLASASEDKTVRLWEAGGHGEGEGEEVYREGRVLKGHTGAVWALCSMSNALLLSGSWDSSIRVWDLKEFRDDDVTAKEF